MRAATLIVGAIAAASILIALAFVLSGEGSSKNVTKTVTEEIVEAPAPATEESAGESSGGEPSTRQFGGPTQCGGGEFTVENVTCEVGAQIREGYEEGGRGEIMAQDQKAAETITMSCSGTAPVECQGPGGAKVYFGG